MDGRRPRLTRRRASSPPRVRRRVRQPLRAADAALRIDDAALPGDGAGARRGRPRRGRGRRSCRWPPCPTTSLVYLLPSRYCLPDELGAEAWRLFGQQPPGWARVQAVADHVHDHVTFGYGTSSAVTTAADVYRSGQGVCRDYAHLAISFCRALNIPARYVFGYIPDIEVPPPDEPMDFCAWFEAYLDGSWHTFDARLNAPPHRPGRGRPRPRCGRRGDADLLRPRRSRRLRGRGRRDRTGSRESP